MHLIGSTFGEVLRSESKGEYGHIRVLLEVQEPLRRGIFILFEEGQKSSVPFKYEKLSGFCFGCSRIEHAIKECGSSPVEIKTLPKDDLPFSLALKVELNFLGKVSLKLGSSMEKQNVPKCVFGFVWCAYGEDGH